MERIKNRKCINKLSIRMLAVKRQKNLITIFAIILTSVLFTAVFTIGSGIIESFQESTMRQVGGRSMSGIKYILPKDYEKLSKDPKVKNPSYRILISGAENKELLKLSTEINYATDENAEAMFCLPSHGKMPEGRLELATSTLVLDALKLPYKLGETVTLEFSICGKKILQDFTLSGYWEGDKVAIAQQCFLSKKYCDEMVSTPTVSINENNNGNYEGYWMMDFDFSNSWNIEKKTRELLKRNGYNIKKTNYGINWAYTTGSIDLEFIITFIEILCLILASGYLIIYNIFSMNITIDIQSYGLYKTIGMTEKQLKKLVHRQALFFSVIGIPCGLILGAISGKLLFPIIIINYSTGGIARNSWNPFIFLGAAIVSFLTIWISCSRPCRLAAKVSPMEAVKYIETKNGNKKKKKKRTVKVTPYSFGLTNIGRNKKKVALVVCSLSLSMILLNSMYVIIHGFHLDRYVSNLMLGDAMICDATVLNMQIMERNFHGVTTEMQETMKNMEGVEELHNVYVDDSILHLNKTGLSNFNVLIKSQPEMFDGMKEYISYIREEKKLDCWVYGIDEWGIGQIESFQGTIDWEKFQSGDYVFISSWGSIFEENPLEGIYYQPGDKLTLELPDGTEKEYEVMAIAKVPYAMSCRAFHNFGVEMILPESEYLSHTKDMAALFSILFMKKGEEDIGYENLKNYTEHAETTLDCILKQTYEKEFEDYVNMYWIAGGMLSLVLAIIGILNFINAVTMGILTRKREFAMMEAIGMTGRQMKHMLAWEGGFYALFTAAVSILAGSLIQELVLKRVMKDVWIFEFHFMITPIFICLPMLLMIACTIPIVAYRKMAKESVVERLRETE